MARIRTIKPEFFRHFGLYEAEVETGLPLRLAFAGLWTACDREGRFRWSPRELKLDCLPHDEVDFSRVLDALATRGFIRCYEVDASKYGCIPSWHSHQIVNNRETASKLPDPDQGIDIEIELTRAPRVDDACPTRLKGKGTGREGKGRERKGKGMDLARVADASPDLVSAWEAWNALAADCKLPQAQILTEPRKASLAARLRECGGIDGWHYALSKIRGSEFLIGKNDRGWKADLDFVLQRKRFTKIMEGGYDRGPPKAVSSNGFAENMENMRNDFKEFPDE